MPLHRRSLLAGALTLGAAQAFPGLSHAQARKLVFATFTGSWEEAHRAVLVPAFRKSSGGDVILDPMLSVDQIAKVQAARANPPIDVMLHDPGPALTAIAQDLVEPYPVAQSAHYGDLIADAQEPMGPAPFFQIVGLTYNPEKVKTPPTSWADLWKPEFKGRVGITNLNSTLGTGFLVEIARMHGGSETDVEPGFKALEALKPNLAAVAANPGALAALYQQEQVDIGPGNFNAIQILKARGVPVEFAAPKEGIIAFKTTIHIVKNTPSKELAFRLIEAALSPEVQAKLMQSPYLIVPTNRKVAIEGEVAKVLAKDADELKRKSVFQDWAAINRGRPAWIERFNREIRV
ncbi:MULTISPECIES: ABC transporter substrate-binding protein [unclassified Methylobacterium]|uniref:ABC transporter substrate-binding protein n=1 Tax=unclassified Methylobacterium TaxID=2615210 RepID=UPI0006F2F7E0|nr:MULTISPECIES: ABC transporter substrate-binding protein [unclassified Methylobacterium]KQS79865.1 ABC transporter substrate-binding protein [Methylobacterium sp. Leaf361]MBN4094733.1 ABC transporter substrate-binding protein [Methylobacterium sp. OT2]